MGGLKYISGGGGGVGGEGAVSGPQMTSAKLRLCLFGVLTVRLINHCCNTECIYKELQADT